MKEIHGIADGSRQMAVSAERNKEVTVTDGNGIVKLCCHDAPYSIGLSPAQATFIAKLLLASAKRVETLVEAQP